MRLPVIILYFRNIMKALVKEMNLGFITADPPVVMSSQPKQQETSLLLHILFYKQNHINMQLNNCILINASVP